MSETNEQSVSVSKHVTISVDQKTETIELKNDEELDEIDACLGLMSGRGYRGYQAWESAMKAHYWKKSESNTQ